jgi:CxxC motif-containing protein (DUF1111 family)
MGAWQRAWGFAVLLVVTGGLPRGIAAAENDSAAVKRGQLLFQRVWQHNSAADATSDGLGPLFNERSCAACHFLGGLGGAGRNEHNVQLLTAMVSNKRDNSALQSRLNKLHRGFGTSTSIVLHRYGSDPRYAEFREDLLGLKPDDADQLVPLALASARKQEPVRTIKAAGAKLVLSERNTTTMLGTGLIDSISIADIRNHRALQVKQNPRITGRFLGRFGWRGQSNDLGDFIRGACAVELGLQVRTHAQAVDPLPGAAQPIARETVDLTDDECNDLTAFARALPAPPRQAAADSGQAQRVEEGQQLFYNVGCAACHPATLGEVSGIYSDLLVHDMGPRLMDPLPARFESSQVTPSGTYYGPPPVSPGELALELRREWKTPPLWGVHDTGPYLHDGRAATLEEAISLHAGEASDAARRYQFLSRESRDRLLAFLHTLGAPEGYRLAKPKPPAPAINALSAQ